LFIYYYYYYFILFIYFLLRKSVKISAASYSSAIQNGSTKSFIWAAAGRLFCSYRCEFEFHSASFCCV